MQGKKARSGGPLAVVRLYDSMLSTLKELTEVASQLGGAAGEYLLDECSAKVIASVGSEFHTSVLTAPSGGDA